MRFLKASMAELHKNTRMTEENLSLSTAKLKSTMENRIKSFQADLKYRVAQCLSSLQASAEHNITTAEIIKTTEGSAEEKASISEELEEVSVLADSLEEGLTRLLSVAIPQALQAKKHLEDRLSLREEEISLLLDKNHAIQADLRVKHDQLEDLTERHRGSEEDRRILVEESEKAKVSLTELRADAQRTAAILASKSEELAGLALLLEETNSHLVSLTESGRAADERLHQLMAENETARADLDALRAAQENVNFQQDHMIVLRIELERLREQHSKEKRRLQLLVADLEDEVALLKTRAMPYCN